MKASSRGRRNKSAIAGFPRFLRPCLSLNASQTRRSFPQTQMNERRTTRYFRCFRPADDVDGERRLVRKKSYDDRGSTSARFGSIWERDLKCPGKTFSVDGNMNYSRRCYSDRLMKSASKDEGDAVFTHISGYATGGDSVSQASGEVPTMESGRRKRSRKAFARVVNALAFITVATKSRNGKSSQGKNRPSTFSSRTYGEDKNGSDSFPTRRIYSVKCPVKPNEYPLPPKHETQKVDSSGSFSLSSMSSSASIADSLDSLGEKGSRGCRYHSSSTTVLCLLAFSLTIMILWGRLCAIVWTSAWLFFVPRARSETSQKMAYSPPESIVKLPEVEMKEYKKRIIMEGLLGRNHCQP